MKKILAISSAFLMITAAFTGCGENRGDNGRDDGSYYEDHDYGYGSSDRTDGNNGRGNSAGDHVSDAVDGAKDAGEDIINGVGDAANDIVDGLDGDRESDSSSTTRSSRSITTGTTANRR